MPATQQPPPTQPPSQPPARPQDKSKFGDGLLTAPTLLATATKTTTRMGLSTSPRRNAGGCAI
eukprot:2387497-Rhodomonas_salina.1